ncbi:MAG: peptidylprolyl isomerase [Candidatus Glassbacteria bacterium]|nr:peptidylprolyl isomerase [Candidatus Glassbacteria bacterium]
MAKAKEGDTVRVHYTGKLEDKTVFGSSADSEPLQFTIGENQIIPGFEEAVVGMKAGEAKTARVPAEKAYGSHRKEMVLEVERSQFPDHLDPKVGEQLQINQADNQPVLVTVAEVSEDKVTLDANHPLAGKELTFEIELVEIL